jgi:predicted nucleic acid-binding protein
MKVVLDTNCFINAVNQTRQAYEAVQVILKASHSDKITLFVSLHSLHELEQKPDEALALAKSLPLLPHFPIGTWGEQVGTWSQTAGTWEDAKRNEEIQNDLKKRVKSGADIRDRGAYIDAVHAHVDVFVTSDEDLAGKGPSSRIAEKYELRIMTPVELASELSSRSEE